MPPGLRPARAIAIAAVCAAALAILALAGCDRGGAAVAKGGVVRNGDLSAGSGNSPAGWQASAWATGAGYTTFTWHHQRGAPPSLEIWNAKSNTADWAQKLHLGPGWYRFTASVRAEGIPRRANSAGAFLGLLEDGIVSRMLYGTTGWTTLGFYLKVEAPGAEVTLACQLGGHASPNIGKGFCRDIRGVRVAQPAPDSMPRHDLDLDLGITPPPGPRAGGRPARPAPAAAIPSGVHPLLLKPARATRFDIIFTRLFDIFEWIMALAVIAALAFMIRTSEAGDWILRHLRFMRPRTDADASAAPAGPVPGGVSGATATLRAHATAWLGVAAVPPTARCGRVMRRAVAFLTRDEWQVVAFVLIVKVLLYWYGLVSYEVHLNRWVHSPTEALRMWSGWDAPHYLAIALYGYGAVGRHRLFLAFYPLYPWLIRLLTFVTRSALGSALIISNLASIVLAVLMLRLVALDYGIEAGRRAVWFLFLFPTAYFLQAPYTESLFIALVVGSFLACRHGRWFFAGILGGLAAFTRAPGILLAAALAIEAIQELLTTRRWNYRWLWIGLVPLGFAGFLAVNYWVTGNPFTFLAAEAQNWTEKLSVPWAFLRQLDVLRYMKAASGEVIGVQVFIYVLIGLGATLASAWFLRPSYTAWMAANWLIIAGQTWDLSAPRYLLAMFPMFILAARGSRSRLCFAALTIWSLLFLALFSSEFVIGHWAF
jgi:hypothetical protein